MTYETLVIKGLKKRVRELGLECNKYCGEVSKGKVTTIDLLIQLGEMSAEIARLNDVINSIYEVAAIGSKPHKVCLAELSRIKKSWDAA